MAINFDKLTLGVCYYPEHWADSMIDEDMKRMKAMGIEVIRIAEFAWSIFECEEGQFSFDYFDMVMDKAQYYGLKVIFCTPTATPPAWLVNKYPQVLNKTMDGRRFGHGMRRHVNFSSEKFIELSAIIVEKLAEHYGNHPAICGWQIDNEFNCEVAEYYSDADRCAFVEYLKVKYDTLDNLNKAWGTVFWNQTYNKWEQVDLSCVTPSNSVNPHRVLDEKRFFSYSVLKYCKLQSDILRRYIENRFITTNGLFENIDYHHMTEESLDFISYDSYPMFAYEIGRSIEDEDTGFSDRWWSLNLSKVRAVSSVFAVLEQQSSAGGWINRIHMPAPKPGQLRLWVFQSIAHGADFVSFFRWRTSPYGTEIYWRGINDHDNHNNRRIGEIEQLAKDLKKIESLAGEKYYAPIGILHDYDNEWDGQMDVCHGPMSKLSESNIFRTLQKKHIPVDIVNIDNKEKKELSQYKLLFYPHPAIVTERRIDKLSKYINDGGIVVFGARSGYKDINGECYCSTTDYLANKLCGSYVQEWTMLHPNIKNPAISMGDNRIQTAICAEELRLEDASPVGEYIDSYMTGNVAASKRNFGKGYAYYIGSLITDEIVNYLINELDILSPVDKLLDLPDCVEFSKRGDNIFLLNYKDRCVEIRALVRMKNLLSGEDFLGEYTMKPFDVLILRENNER